MGLAAEDLEYIEQQQNSRFHSELNPRGYKTSEDFVWTTKDGTKMKLSEMETSHINNCIRLLKRTIASRPNEYAWGEPEGDMAQDAFNAEIRHNDLIEEETLETVRVMEHELELRKATNDPQPEGDFSGASEDEKWGGR